MILTVSLNPAVDKTCEIGSLNPGEVNRLLRVESVPGGKAVNVTKVLRQCGIDRWQCNGAFGAGAGNQQKGTGKFQKAVSGLSGAV